MSNILTIALKEPISIKGIRDLILDLKVSENDSLLLHSNNFDEIALEFRKTYKESIKIPYYLLNVLIIEDYTQLVGVNIIGILKDSNYQEDSHNNASSDTDFNSPDESHRNDTIYRCGWCGNVVDFDGAELDPMTRNYIIKIYEKFTDTIELVKVNGDCCRGRVFKQ